MKRSPGWNYAVTNRNQIRSLAIALALLVAPAAARAQGAAFKLVVNAANPVTALSASDASNLFLGKVSTWKDGRPAVVVDQPDNGTRAAFSRSVLHKSAATVKRYWQQMVFSGRAVPPAELASDADVLAFVRAHPTAIGYVSAAASVGGDLRVVRVN